MHKPSEKALTYEMVIAEIMSSVAGPLPAQELAAQMLSALPSFARNPQQAMRQHIRHANGRQLVFLDTETIMPLRLAYQRARFRIPLERESFDKGLLPLGNAVSSYLPQGYKVDRLRLVDASGSAIPAQIKQAKQRVQSPFGPVDETHAFANLSAWYRTQKMYAKDHILVTILDWEQGILQLEREPFGQRNQALLAERNRLLAELFFELIESAAREDIYVHAAVPTVYAHLPDKGGCPPNHWWDVLEADGRMDSNGFMIFYRDSDNPFRQWDEDDLKDCKAISTQTLSKAQREQVYRFKAHILHRPKIWREIEIQGKQTLADLDISLRDAFNHDVFDHVGGFWKLIPRAAQAKTMSKHSSGRTARTREVAIGNVEPMGGGDGARIKIAELDLAVGEQLKYVYDFGDWIEHHLTLRTIEAPQSSVEYPREAARNQPEYAFCVECQKKGKQQVAKWICLECTTGPEQEILLCEKCANKHDDHYLEEILY